MAVNIQSMDFGDPLQLMFDLVVVDENDRVESFKLFVEGDLHSREGNWRLQSHPLINLLAWSTAGTFKKVCGVLYFYSEAKSKIGTKVADFFLTNAPVSVSEVVVFDRSGDGVITNGRNGVWMGATIDWSARAV